VLRVETARRLGLRRLEEEPLRVQTQNLILQSLPEPTSKTGHMTDHLLMLTKRRQRSVSVRLHQG